MTKKLKTKIPGTTLKATGARVGLMLLAAGGWLALAGCVVRSDGRVGVGVDFPVVTVAPAVEVEPVMVPEAYTWDGYEEVGLVGDQYYYLGAGNVWLVAGPDRMEHFRGWERGHPDWRNHAIRNDRYRRDARGHTQPRRDDKR